MIEFLKEIVSEAGALALARQPNVVDGASSLQFKGEKDLVTVVDREVEDFLIDAIRKRYPDHGVLGEETGDATDGCEFHWIIDPIDGTTSYVHDQPFFSTSVAVRKSGRIVAGAVSAPRLGELFWAERGGGAWLGTRRIAVSERAAVVESVIGTGFACLRANWTENNLPAFGRVASRARGVRRFGSAAVDLAYVACGRLDAFWELNLKIYDVAAGALFVEEAGGMVCDCYGGDAWPARGMVASNGRVHRELLDLLVGDENKGGLQ
jgi:myo-inositol-1(or 4)-monophosphatase